MINYPDCEEFGIFGESVSKIIDLLFNDTYKKIVIVSPSFCIQQTSNIYPQFIKGDFTVLSCKSEKIIWDNMIRYRDLQNIEVSLDCHRFEHAILINSDLSVITAWAQAEYALMAFKGTLLDEFDQWFDRMREMGVVRQNPHIS